MHPVIAASSNAEGLAIGIGGPVSAALIVALVTWILRLLADRRRQENKEHNELVKTVDDLAKAVKEITFALGGSPATAFEGKRLGLVESVTALAKDVVSLTSKVANLSESEDVSPARSLP